jgi:acetyltransferase-like isoleucine patch superfamily enzyme
MMRRLLEHTIRTTALLAGRLRIQLLRVRGINVGPKSRLGPRSTVTRPSSVTIGTRVEIEQDVFIKVSTDDASLLIGDYTFIGARCTLHVAGRIVIGSHTLIGDGVVIADHTHGRRAALRLDEQGLRIAPVTIGDDVLINPNALIGPGVTVGNGAIVAAAAVVTRDVPPLAIVAGIPARVIAWRT